MSLSHLDDRSHHKCLKQPREAESGWACCFQKIQFCCQLYFVAAHGVRFRLDFTSHSRQSARAGRLLWSLDTRVTHPHIILDQFAPHFITVARSTTCCRTGAARADSRASESLEAQRESWWARPPCAGLAVPATGSHQSAPLRCYLMQAFDTRHTRESGSSRSVLRCSRLWCIFLLISPSTRTTSQCAFVRSLRPKSIVRARPQTTTDFEFHFC